MDDKNLNPKYLKILKDEIIYWSKRLSRGGILRGFEGNISTRLGTKYLLITAAISDKQNLELDDILLSDMDGKLVSPTGGTNRKISPELIIHREIYLNCPQTRAIIHGHPIYGILSSLLNIPMDRAILPEALVYFGEIASVPFSMPGSKESASEVKKHLPAKKAMLLKNHGALTHGPNLSVAGCFMEMVEKICKIHYLALAKPENIDAISQLPADIRDKLLAMHNSFNSHLDSEEW